jgi:uncharacterized protein (DUF1501 family)
MMKTKTIQRRDFLKSTAAAGVGLIILPSGVLSGANAPSNKLNVAMIGTLKPNATLTGASASNKRTWTP